MVLGVSPRNVLVFLILIEGIVRELQTKIDLSVYIGLIWDFLQFQIYHGRFYDTCKSHKAVEEAFSFTNFIGNPTLSTFNMLMSVCTNSQDLEG